MLVLGTLVPGDDTPEPQEVDGPRMVARGQGVVAHERATGLPVSILPWRSFHPPHPVPTQGLWVQPC